MKYVLIIAGHGGKDKGTHGKSMETGGQINESKLNLNVARAFRDKLQRPGVTVELSREDDTYMSPTAQLKLSNRRLWDAVIAVHHNGSTSTKAKGCEILHNANAASERLADSIMVQFKALGQEIHGQGDGTFVSPRTLALKKCKSPCVYTEFAFLTGPDIAVVDTKREQDAEANAIAYGALVAMGVV